VSVGVGLRRRPAPHAGDVSASMDCGLAAAKAPRVLSDDHHHPAALHRYRPASQHIHDSSNPKLQRLASAPSFRSNIALGKLSALANLPSVSLTTSRLPQPPRRHAEHLRLKNLRTGQNVRIKPGPIVKVVRHASRYLPEGLAFPRSRVSSGFNCVALRFSR
jgi:hypothetical protein